MAVNTVYGGAFVTKSATANISAIPVNLIGILCNSTSSGTIILYDSATTGTGTPITGTFSPAAGTFTPIPAVTQAGLYAVIGGTLSVTFFYQVA
jgi:hypothetical protein